jgi:hypothetical protein
MNRYLALFTTALTLPILAIPVEARQLYKDSRKLEITVSQQTGHLIDWSQTDRRIRTIGIDNPELFTRNFIFNADGCTPKKCTNASMLLISARPMATIGQCGTLRVIAVDRQGKLHPYTITIKVTKNTPDDNETRFEPENQIAKP